MINTYKFKLIAHRGLLNGSSLKLENNFQNILDNIKKYPFIINELDIWIKSDSIYVGHNNPSYKKIIEQSIDNICHEYIKSIQWTFDYYFNKCSNWRWYYNYHFSPLLKDLSNYLTKIETFDQLIENNNKPYKPEEQLKIVLPHQNDTYYYPKFSPLYSVMKRYYWECHPIMID